VNKSGMKQLATGSWMSLGWTSPLLAAATLICAFDAILNEVVVGKDEDKAEFGFWLHLAHLHRIRSLPPLASNSPLRAVGCLRF